MAINCDELLSVQEFAQFHLNRGKMYEVGATDELLKGLDLFSDSQSAQTRQ